MSECFKKVFKFFKKVFTFFQNSSCEIDELEKCFKSTNGPVVHQSRKYQTFVPSMQLVTPMKTPCKIFICTKNTLKLNGLGCYYGNDKVLTALHVFEDLEKLKIFVYFTNGEIELIYKAILIIKYPDRDLAVIELFGDTSRLGLENHIAETAETGGGVYFYSLDSDGNFQKKEGQTCRPYSSMRAQMCTDEFVMSAVGKAGDSGSPVYNDKDELIGIYRGVFTHPKVSYGRYIKISGSKRTFLKIISDLQTPESCLIDMIGSFQSVESIS